MKKYVGFLLIVMLGAITSQTHAQRPKVYAFFDTECPICQKSSTRLQDLYSAYRKEIDFEAVYPMRGVSRADVRRFRREYGFRLPTFVDTEHRVVKQLNARITPEVVLLDAQGQEVYRGAIDNQFFELGKNRPKVTEFYLKDAIVALLQHQPVAIAKTEAVGCLINRKK